MLLLTPSAQESSCLIVSSPPNPDHRHIKALDGLRGFAVLAVFCFHYGGGAQSANPALRAIGTVNKFGWSGVTLFYVLSGFLITGIVWDSLNTHHWARNFYMRRFLRIFPLYYLAILIFILAGLYQHVFAATLKAAAVFALFSQNIPYFFIPDKIAPLYHLGSIAVEEQFYLLWPLLLLIFSKPFSQPASKPANRYHHPLLLCLAVFVGSLLFRLTLYHLNPQALVYFETLPARAGELAAGAALALLYRTPHWATVQRLAPPVFFLGMAAFLLTSWFTGSFQLDGQTQEVYGLSAVSLAYAALLALATRPGIVERLASAAWLRWLGRISYGIYVFHLLIIHFVNQFAARLAHAHRGDLYQALRFLIAAVITLSLATLSLRFYERPVLRLKRFFQSPPAVPTPFPHP